MSRLREQEDRGPSISCLVWKVVNLIDWGECDVAQESPRFVGSVFFSQPKKVYLPLVWRTNRHVIRRRQARWRNAQCQRYIFCVAAICDMSRSHLQELSGAGEAANDGLLKLQDRVVTVFPSAVRSQATGSSASTMAPPVEAKYGKTGLGMKSGELVRFGKRFRIHVEEAGATEWFYMWACCDRHESPR